VLAEAFVERHDTKVIENLFNNSLVKFSKQGLCNIIVRAIWSERDCVQLAFHFTVVIVDLTKEIASACGRFQLFLWK
jgi:hypothetical protein